MNALKEECQQLRDELIALRREFHRAPELGLHEYHTAARIERELDRCGIPHERVGETAVAGHLTGNGNGSGLVVLRADIDALPIQETNDVPYRSQTPGMMHACGHDAHTTCLLGAAKVLSAHRADFGGEVRFLFQPAEEIGQGARPLIAAGMLDGAQRVFGLHTGVRPSRGDRRRQAGGQQRGRRPLYHPHPRQKRARLHAAARRGRALYRKRARRRAPVHRHAHDLAGRAGAHRRGPS